MLTVARPTNKKIAINPYKRIRINLTQERQNQPPIERQNSVFARSTCARA
jgi:hypothetical protein